VVHQTVAHRGKLGANDHQLPLGCGTRTAAWDLTELLSNYPTPDHQ